MENEKEIIIAKQTEDDEKGQLDISEGVISSIISLGISDISGFCGICNKKLGSKGVKILDLGDGDIELNISIVIKQGVNIPSLCKIIRDKVKENVELMTGYKINKINIFVDDVKA